LASLVAASLGLANTQVVATDGNPNVVELAQQNLKANRDTVLQQQATTNSTNQADALIGASDTTGSLQARVLPWGLLEVDEDLYGSAQVILGSDLTYNVGSWPLLAETMEACLAPNGWVIYLSCGHAGFNVQAELDGFLQVAQGKGLQPVPPPPLFRDENHRSLVEDPVQWLKETCKSAEERSILESGGGARVVFLQKKTRKNRTRQ
jgi:hypothetical protein